MASYDGKILNGEGLLHLVGTIKAEIGEGSEGLPSYSSGDAGKVLAVNQQEDGVEWVETSGGSSEWPIYKVDNWFSPNLAKFPLETKEWLEAVARDGFDKHPGFLTGPYNDTQHYQSTVQRIVSSYGNYLYFTYFLCQNTATTASDSDVSFVFRFVFGTNGTLSNVSRFNGKLFTETDIKINKNYSLSGTTGTLRNELTYIKNNYATKAELPEDELPAIAAGDAGKVLAVNSGETGVEWITASSSGGGSGVEPIIFEANDIYTDGGTNTITDTNTINQFTDFINLGDSYNPVVFLRLSGNKSIPLVYKSSAVKTLFFVGFDDTQGKIYYYKLTYKNSSSPNQGLVLTRIKAYNLGDFALKSEYSEEKLPVISAGDAGKVLSVNSTEDGAEWITAPAGGGTTYTAGTGIDITNGVISINLTSAESEGF